MNLESIINKATQTLKNHDIRSSRLDAEIILADIMGVVKEYLLTNNKENVSTKNSLWSSEYQHKT